MKKILIINNSLDPNNQDFVNSILRIVGKGDVVHFSQIDQIDQKYDGVILSGAPMCDRDILHKRIKHYSWIKKYKKPLLGICAGHQLIGLIFGSLKISDNEKEFGDYEIFKNSEDPLFDGLNFPIKVAEMHTDSISLPDDFILLVHSRKCRVEAMKHQSKVIYGLEFHPEQSQTKILENFVKMI